MATSLENFGTLEYVQDKYSKLWCWKITGDLAIDKISTLSSKAWYGENENEVIIEDSTESIKQLKLMMDRFPLEILSNVIAANAMFDGCLLNASVTHVPNSTLFVTAAIPASITHGSFTIALLHCGTFEWSIYQIE